jgi:DNA-binding transcriptional regulator YiaG
MKNDIDKLASMYPKTVRWSDADEAFVGTVHGLVGDCCHGNDPCEVYQQCEEIARECVEAAFFIKKKLPKPPVKLKPIPSLPVPDPAVIRKALGLSQVEFSKFLGISPKTLHKWEQKTSQPSGAARSLLKIAAEKPKTVLQVLGE